MRFPKMHLPAIGAAGRNLDAGKRFEEDRLGVQAGLYDFARNRAMEENIWPGQTLRS